MEQKEKQITESDLFALGFQYDEGDNAYFIDTGDCEIFMLNGDFTLAEHEDVEVKTVEQLRQILRLNFSFDL